MGSETHSPNKGDRRSSDSSYVFVGDEGELQHIDKDDFVLTASLYFEDDIVPRRLSAIEHRSSKIDDRLTNVEITLDNQNKVLAKTQLIAQRNSENTTKLLTEIRSTTYSAIFAKIFAPLAAGFYLLWDYFRG